MCDQLVERYVANGGRRENILFLPHVSDETLAAIYRGGAMTIVASLIEGFSLPVVEASASGSIVLVSDCEAHLELVDTRKPFSVATPSMTLSPKALAIGALDPAERARILARQRDGVERFRLNAVREKFWTRLHETISARRGAAVIHAARRPRPRLAFATPWPPEQSGVANYSYNTVKALSRHADVDVFCEVPPMEAAALPGVKIRPLSGRIPQQEYDRSFYVVGNSHFHHNIILQLAESGGTTIIHDSRLLEYYLWRTGGATPEFQTLARRMAGCDVSRPDIEQWLADSRTLPSLFLDDIIGVSDEVVVHHPGFARELKARYDRQPIYIPFAIPQMFGDDELAPDARRAVKKALDLAPDRFHIVTFGYVAPSKGITECIFSLGELNDWKVSAELHLVGKLEENLKEKIIQDARFARSSTSFTPSMDMSTRTSIADTSLRPTAASS